LKRDNKLVPHGVASRNEALPRKDTSMSQKPVITVEDITNVALQERRSGCGKGVLHEDAPVLTAVYRVQPSSGVPTPGSTIFSWG